MKCPSCGHENPTEAPTCGHCHRSLAAPSADAAAHVPLGVPPPPETPLVGRGTVAAVLIFVALPVALGIVVINDPTPHPAPTGQGYGFIILVCFAFAILSALAIFCVTVMRAIGRALDRR